MSMSRIGGPYPRVKLGGVDISAYVSQVEVTSVTNDVDGSVHGSYRMPISRAPEYEVVLSASDVGRLAVALLEAAGRFEVPRNGCGVSGGSIYDEAFRWETLPFSMQDRAASAVDTLGIRASLDAAWGQYDTERALAHEPREATRAEPEYVEWHGTNDSASWSSRHEFIQNTLDLPAKLCEQCGMWPDHHDHQVVGWYGEPCVCQECDPDGNEHTPTSMYD